MSLLMAPVFDGNHDPRAVAEWPLDDFSWWYLFRAKRIKAQRDQEKEARRGSKR